MKRPLFKIFIYFVAVIIIMSLGITITIIYHHKVTLTGYIVTNDYSHVINAANKNNTYSKIERLPNKINEELDGVVWAGRVEDDSSKTAVCYVYNYNELNYLKVVITDNKLIQTDQNEIVYYYVED